MGPGWRRPVQRRVDFLICGTQKGGTTALDSYLREHPAICMANRKEVHFFDQASSFHTDGGHYSSYHAHFSPQPWHRRIGEATPIYMYWREAPQRIHAYNPAMRLIVLLRNPIDRAYSHWNMERSRQAETLSFADAIRCEEERCREALPYQHRVFSYLDRGFYLEQLQRLWHCFPRSNILILPSEQLRRQPLATLHQVCDFLAINRLEAVTPRELHCRPYEAAMAPGERQRLRCLYREEIQALERELGWDCRHWLES